MPRFVPRHTPTEDRSCQQNKKFFALLHAHAGSIDETKVTFVNSHTMVMDSGASMTLTPHLCDFVGDITPVQDTTMQGMGSGLEAKGTGTARFQLRSRKGNVITSDVLNCLCVPDLPTVLLCPQQVIDFAKGKDNSFNMTKTNMQFHMNDEIINMT